MEKKLPKDIGFVFLHGAGLGAWIWEELISNLEYPCLAIDLPGRGKHGDITADNLTLNQYVESVLLDINQFKPEKLVIIAHSISGIIGLEVAEKLNNRVIGFVAVSGAIPELYSSYVSCFPFIMRIFLKLMFKLSGTRPPDSVISGGLCNDLDENITTKVIEQFIPESVKLYTDKMQIASVPANSIYIHSLKDKALNDAVQTQMIANLKANQVIDIDSGHLPMLSKPKELARILDSFVKSRTKDKK